MNKIEKILGAGSFISFFGVVIFYYTGSIIFETVGYGILVMPVIGLITALWSVIYAYKGKTLKEIDGLWLIGIFIFWFVLLPIFWYKKIYKPSTNAT